MGDRLAGIGARNGWRGVAINGVIRDSAGIDALGIGVRALGTTARRGWAPGLSSAGKPVSFGGVTLVPGDRVYADRDCVIVAAAELPLPGQGRANSAQTPFAAGIEEQGIHRVEAHLNRGSFRDHLVVARFRDQPHAPGSVQIVVGHPRRPAAGRNVLPDAAAFHRRPHPRGGQMTKIAFIGAGSTVFIKNIIGDALHFRALAGATIALMDIDADRLAESALVARKLVATMGAGARIEAHSDRHAALDGADFVIVAFQIGGYRPCTVTDFEVPKAHGLRQTIADTLGIGGIMRALRTVPHLWAICEDMRALCPDAILLQYVNPMAINTWAIAARYPDIRQVGLCHSVQGTARELARDLGIDPATLVYRAGGINHMAFYTHFGQRQPDGTIRDLYPDLRDGYRAGRIPRESSGNPRCPNLVRYEVMMHLGHFVTESSEHFAEYVPWFIKSHRPELIERFRIPLDEYPRRCEEQLAAWKAQADAYRTADRIEVRQSHEYAATIMNSVLTGVPSVIYGNVANRSLIPQLPEGCAVEVPCLVDAMGIQPTPVADLAPQLTALMRTNVNVQELTVAALLTENRAHVYHAAMLDPRTAAELDLGQIRALVDDLIAAHGEWLPAWAHHRTAA